MKSKKFLASLGVIGALTVGLAGCGTSSSTPSGVANNTSALKGNTNETYYMVTFLSGIEYWKGVYAGMQDAAKALGVKTVYTGAPQYDINQEVTTLQQVIAKKPAGILVTAINQKALTPVINQAIAQGIPVITFDSDAPNSERYGYLGTSNVEAGQKAAKFLGKQLGGHGQVAIVSTPGELNLDQRVQGFKEEMQKDYPGVQIVAEENGNSDQIKTAQVTSTLLQKYPNLAGVFATEADEGTGVATAVKEANKTNSIKIVSFDTDKSTLQQIQSGEITATIAQGTWNMGYWGTMEAFMVHHNLTKPVADWKTAKVDPVPPSVDTGVTVITKNNVSSYLK
ncbi:substrate-binding domain-containing protein [Fodinisporobacter ferrooxydans]|uniref:Substrate-binding domain-containing protein n=1 Tax=Fodinisporobacter ferrooxydans TaxID=2901836 RepID=A0ABY4CKH8_9BACL|nr:substrate-binding domain-containing protein [Alicyclobacillaceae bacterium MYW30-H2]